LRHWNIVHDGNVPEEKRVDLYRCAFVLPSGEICGLGFPSESLRTKHKTACDHIVHRKKGEADQVDPQSKKPKGKEKEKKKEKEKEKEKENSKGKGKGKGKEKAEETVGTREKSRPRRREFIGDTHSSSSTTAPSPSSPPAPIDRSRYLDDSDDDYLAANSTSSSGFEFRGRTEALCL
jgi:hypothetical protein